MTAIAAAVLVASALGGVQAAPSCPAEVSPSLCRVTQALGFTMARSAVPIAVLRDAGIDFVANVPVGAGGTCGPEMGMPPLKVDGDGNGLKVSRVAATRIAAEVVEAGVVRDWPNGELICIPMSTPASTLSFGLNSMPAIAERVLISEPRPAGVWSTGFINFGPEDLLDGWSLIERVAVTPPTRPVHVAESTCLNWVTAGRNATHGTPPQGLVDSILAYGWPCDEALAVAWCESRWQADAIGGDNFGLYQINAVHRARVGGDVLRLLDPATNVRVAYDLWRAEGWSPWWGCRP